MAFEVHWERVAMRRTCGGAPESCPKLGMLAYFRARFSVCYAIIILPSACSLNRSTGFLSDRVRFEKRQDTVVADLWSGCLVSGVG